MESKKKSQRRNNSMETLSVGHIRSFNFLGIHVVKKEKKLILIGKVLVSRIF